MSAILDRIELKYLLIDSLKKYSEDAIYLYGNNPYKFSINKKLYYILIHNVHDSGHGRSNEDECRLQFQRSANFKEAKRSGLIVLFLGYYSKYNVFTAWDPFIQTERINKREVVSVYSRFSVQKRANENGISIYLDGNNQHIITFRPEYLGLYVDNHSAIHRISESALIDLIHKSDEIGETVTGTGEEITVDREKFTVTHTGYKRDPDFTKNVLAAYGNSCAVCGLQLELVLAAHIVPHAHEESLESVINGVCLCSLHHKAFDDGLIYFDSRYRVNLNNLRIDYLNKVNLIGGKQEFVGHLPDNIILPKEKDNHPSVEMIELANKIRAIPV